jgi:hypothetical protein
MHDIPVIANHGSVEMAQAQECFRPKVMGWAKKNSMPVGDVVEPLG